MRSGSNHIIKVFTNDHPDFYRIMGPFLSRREIVAETGFPLWDDDGKTWLVAIDGNEVCGFCSFDTTARGVLLKLGSDYVIPEHRKRGVYRSLFEEREQLTGGERKRAVATISSLPMFLSAGYEIIRSTKRYSVVEKYS